MNIPWLWASLPALGVRGPGAGRLGAQWKGRDAGGERQAPVSTSPHRPRSECLSGVGVEIRGRVGMCLDLPYSGVACARTPVGSSGRGQRTGHP